MISHAPRRGFTMLTVLWVLATAGTIAATALVAGNNASGAARNQVEWTRARWRALGCARRAQRSIDSVLGSRSGEDATNAWRVLSAVLDSSGGSSNCVVSLEAAGARLDVNSATTEMLERFFSAVGRADARRLALDIVALRDSAALPDVRALRRISREIDWSALKSHLTVEPGRISLSAAPAEVLQAVPGFSTEVATAVVHYRASQAPLNELSDVLSLVSHASGRELEERFQEASAVAVVDPDAWLLRATARSGSPPITTVVEWRITRQANHVVVVRSTLR